MKVLKQIGIVFLHWTWGIVQTLAGFIVFLCTLSQRHIWLNGNVCTEIPGRWGGITLGMFTFVDRMPAGEAVYTDHTVRHEHGHTLQSILLGPLWLFVIAFPSLIWAGCFCKWRIKHKKSYYWFYPEAWANAWGGVK